MNWGGYVRAEILSLHDGNIEKAFVDLCERFASLSIQIERADRLRSYAYAREMPPTGGVIDDLPEPITDEWISTGKGSN